MKKILLSVFTTVLLFGSESVTQTDIIPRTINFIIFVAILWYLVGDKIIKFFKERKENIARRFQEIEEKLKESKERKEALKTELANAKKLADEIIENAKKEAELIENKIKSQLREEIELLEKHFEEYKEAETRRIKQEAVAEYLQEILKDIHIDSETAAKIILKAA